MVVKWGLRCLLAGTILVSLLAMSGCRGLGSSPKTNNPPPGTGGTTVTSFTATPTTITSGSAALLSWTTTNATQVTISNVPGTLHPNDTVSVSPTSTTTYTLTATGPNNGQATATVTVTVTPPSTIPTVQVQANPTTINAGQISTVTWTTSNAVGITFNPDISEGEPGTLPLEGHATVSPTQTTTYTATATSQSGATATATVTITVNQVPPTLSFASNPSQILTGQKSTLTWTTTNATSFQIDQGIGPQPLNGSITVQPAVTTTYTATASGPGGTQTAQATVTVPPPGTLAVSITANPMQISAGQTSALTWQSQNALSVDIEPGVGKQATAGTVNVSPAVTTTYTATATNLAGQQASSTVTVTVVGAGDLSKIKHIIFFVQENRSFDMYFGKLGAYKASKGFANDVDSFDPNVSIPGAAGTRVSPFHERTQRTENLSPFWNESHTDIDENPPGHFNMDGFAEASISVPHQFDPNGDRAVGYYDQTDLPVYYELATQFATSDRWFSPVMTQTVPNRMYFFAGTSFGHIDNHDPQPSNGWPQPTIFDSLDNANIPWKYYYLDSSVFLAQWNTWYKNNGQDQGNVRSISEWYSILNDPNADTLLPPVVFIERGSVTGLDEHPENNVTIGAGPATQVIEALLHSAAWQSSVMIFTYDEGGGLYDHVPPFGEVSPDGIKPMLGPNDVPGDFNFSGFRIPLIVISPWVKPHFVSHVPRDATAILKLIETRFNLPPLTQRDAAQDNMLEFFDFSAPTFINPPPLPAQPVCAKGTSPCDDPTLETHP
jgi:phospholipase C